MKYIHWQIRPPKELAEQIAALAIRNRRSINGQVIYMLEQYLISNPPPPDLPKSDKPGTKPLKG